MQMLEINIYCSSEVVKLKLPRPRATCVTIYQWAMVKTTANNRARILLAVTSWKFEKL